MTSDARARSFGRIVLLATASPSVCGDLRACSTVPRREGRGWQSRRWLMQWTTFYAKRSALRAKGEIPRRDRSLTAANRASVRLTARAWRSSNPARRRRWTAARAVRRPPARRSTEPSTGEVVEVDASGMTVEALRSGWRAQRLSARPRPGAARNGPPQLASGIDAALGAFDATEAGDHSVDRAWYFAAPYSRSSRDPRKASAGSSTGRWGRSGRCYSPRMLFELFEVVRRARASAS